MAEPLRIPDGTASLRVPVCIDAAIVRFVARESRISPVRFDQVEEVFAPWPATRADLAELRRRLARLVVAGWLVRSGPELRQRWTVGSRAIPSTGPLPDENPSPRPFSECIEWGTNLNFPNQPARKG
jgi:hypothetical protein